MKYHLYLDEMLENLTTGVDYFSFAGFAVSEIERDILDTRFNKLKNEHGIDGVLHWTDVRRLKKLWSQKSENEIRLFLKDNEKFSRRLQKYSNEFKNIRKSMFKKQFKGYDNRGDLFGIHLLE